MLRHTMARVLVAGTGITGAATAAALRQELPEDATITLWDKSHGAGGRMSTSRKPGDDTCTVDLGAQYFTLTPQYKTKRQSLFDELESAGVFKPFKGVLEGDNSVDCRHYVTPAGSGSLVKHYLAKSGAEAKYEHHISQVDFKSGDGQAVQVTTQAGTSQEFDAVILTMPVPQILQLKGAIQQSIDVPPSVLVHTSVPFSLQHLETDKEAMKPLIMQHLRDILPDLPEPEVVKSHKWRYSQVFQQYEGSPGCVVLETKPLVILAGDAFAQKGNFSGALDSAEATVQAVTKSINSSL
ncbi:renalase-like isoform X2 [Haliotis rufescens]|uniref:renalase-like isoform X2 n=1 Tax=Haliotis rufescens TaxID=6454 RepID=UPI00201E7F38|nr:renalase-like isoform X2 [Haliotis rufescens]